MFSAVKKSVLNRRFLARFFVFILVLAPFIIIIPFLEAHYPGAVFDRQSLQFHSYRFYLYYWLSNLSFSFLYTSADIGTIYTVEIFGALFLTAIPFFLLGVKKAISKLDFYTFILIGYLLTPILFGVAYSVNYSHRLISILPFFIILVTLGIQSFVEYCRRSVKSSGLNHLIAIFLATSISLFTLVHFFQFFSYYYFEYPRLNDTKHAFGNDLNSQFFRLAQLSHADHLTPYVQSQILDGHGDGNQFYNIAYFNETIHSWGLGQTLPDHSILLTQNDHLDGCVKSASDVNPYFILIKK